MLVVMFQTSGVVFPCRVVVLLCAACRPSRAAKGVGGWRSSRLRGRDYIAYMEHSTMWKIERFSGQGGKGKGRSMQQEETAYSRVPSLGFSRNDAGWRL